MEGTTGNSAVFYTALEFFTLSRRTAFHTIESIEEIPSEIGMNIAACTKWSTTNVVGIGTHVASPMSHEEQLMNALADESIDRKWRPRAQGYLLEVCKLVQKELLQSRRITLWFDLNSGSLSAWRCNAIGRIIQALVEDICRNSSTVPGGEIAITLHNSGQIWVLAVTDKGIRTHDHNLLQSQVSPVEELAAILKADCRMQLHLDGATNAVLFIAKPWWSSASELVTLT